MEALSKKETFSGLKIFKLNPYALIETALKGKRLRKEEKMLQMKLAILTGGIKKVK